MEKPITNYECLIRITKAISMPRDPEEVVLITVEGVTQTVITDIKPISYFEKVLEN